MAKKIWICCSQCGSREVTRDGLLRWCEEAQAWEAAGELDNTDCSHCGEVNLDEVPIIPDADIESNIRELGYTVSEDDGYFTLERNGVQYGVDFEELADAYLWASYHDAESQEAA